MMLFLLQDTKKQCRKVLIPWVMKAAIAFCKPISFTATSADQIPVDRFFELPSWKWKKELAEVGEETVCRIDIQHSERKKVERMNLRTTSL
jgi:hypothetical protein